MKEEDELLRQIGEAMGSPDFLDDPRWARLAAGELSADEIEKLRFHHQRMSQALDALWPMDEAMHARIESLFHRADLCRPQREESGSSFKVLPGWLDWLRGRRMLISGLVTAAAVVLVFVVWPRGFSPLPQYELLFDGGEQAMRTGGGRPDRIIEPPELTPESLIHIRLRPATRAPDVGSIGLISMLKGAQGVRRIELPFRASNSGTLFIEGTVAQLFGTAVGDYQLVLAVVRKSHESQVLSQMEALVEETTRDSPWQVFVQPLRLVDE